MSTDSVSSAGPDRESPDSPSAVRTAILIACLLFLFLAGVKGLGDGFKLLGADLLDSFFATTSNPFVALMVGLLATTLVQSSSVTTSMVVGLVAAPENPLPLANAVPMIMGANIGTTVTNTVVSLAHMGRVDEFRRAFAVATCHDFFNYMSVIVLLPLEMATGFLSSSATNLAATLSLGSGLDFDSPLSVALKAMMVPAKKFGEALFDLEPARGALMILFAGAMISYALLQIVKVLRSAMLDKAENFLNRTLGRSAIVAMAVGAIVTAMVQSSSITTSLLVPLAGAAVITLEQAFPVTLGANVGTTLTALMASLAVAGPNAKTGVIIALTHLMFNLAGTLLIYPIPAIRRIPLTAAQSLADLAVKSKWMAVAYVLVLFYGLPALFAFLQ